MNSPPLKLLCNSCLCAVIKAENDCLREQISAINKELEITKEKLNTLEQAWENICGTGMYLNDHALRLSCQDHNM